MAVTKISDIVVPRVFDPYFRQRTAETSRLAQSGALQENSLLAQKLAGGGLTFDAPSFQDLENDSDDVVSDDDGTDATPGKIGTSNEVAVRLSRHKSWSSMRLAAQLAGADPLDAIADAVSRYWRRRLQAAFIATLEGVFADNDANDDGDYTHDITDTFDEDDTTFSAPAFIEAMGTMGDRWDELALVMMHSVVFQRAQKRNLIDFIRPSDSSPQIPTFMGREVIVDDSMPSDGGDYETWLLGRGALQWGSVTPDDGTEIDRKPSAGNGGGQDVLHTRMTWAIHPVGHKYDGSAPNGGPSNAATSDNLADAGSWDRVYPERKQIRIARLLTTEHSSS